jgi:hypothetical protein
MTVTGRAAPYKEHAPEPWVRHLHRCHTKVLPLHPKPCDFQAVRSTPQNEQIPASPGADRREAFVKEGPAPGEAPCDDDPQDRRPAGVTTGDER